MDLSTEIVVVLAIGGAYLVNQLFAILKSRGVDLPKMAQQIDDLHEVHLGNRFGSARDANGVPRWWNTDEQSREEIKLASILESLDRLERQLTALIARENQASGSHDPPRSDGI